MGATSTSADELGQAFQRIVEIDREHCLNCGRELNIISAITKAQVIERVLTHLALAARLILCAATKAQENDLRH